MAVAGLRVRVAVIRRRITTAYGLLIAANIAAWVWALAAFHDRPLLLSTALLAYSFGLRHGFDADHIAAIDNATRKLMHDGQRPIAAGFFFAFGHSTVVIGLSLAVAFTAASAVPPLDTVQGIGSTIGTSISALFLFAIAAANIGVLAGLYRRLRAVSPGPRTGEAAVREAHLPGFLMRLLRPAFRLVRRSWHMYPVGLLFGLGFDTATEIGLLGIAAAQAAHGLSVWSILCFPALFTAGMTLVDMTDSILMVRAYGWALMQPVRKLYYNLTITLASIVAALFLGSVEALGLVRGTLSLKGPFWQAIDWVSNSNGLIGYGLVGFFIMSWLASIILYKTRTQARHTASA
jgi:high-affinity nickel-transport protein